MFWSSGFFTLKKGIIIATLVKTWLYLWRLSLTVVLLNGLRKYSAMILRKMKHQVITILDPFFLKIPQQTHQKRANLPWNPKAHPIMLPNNVHINIYLYVEFKCFLAILLVHISIVMLWNLLWSWSPFFHFPPALFLTRNCQHSHVELGSLLLWGLGPQSFRL